MKKFFIILSFGFFSFFFSKSILAQECSLVKGCYRENAGITGPDCSCPWIVGGDNSNCDLGNCPKVIDCVWNDWNTCSKACGGGIQTRTIKTPAENGGKECIGSTSQSCNTEPCPYYRISDCDTNTGRYACINDGEHGTKTTYTSMSECERDAKCEKSYFEEVLSNCWIKTVYTVQQGGMNLAVGDLNDDGRDDLFSIDIGCSVAFLANQGSGKFAKADIFQTIALGNTNYQKCQSIVGKNKDFSFILRTELSNSNRKRDVYTGFLDIENKKLKENIKTYEVLSNQGYQNFGLTVSSKYVDVNNDGNLDLIFALGDSYFGSHRGRGLYFLYGGSDGFVGEEKYEETLSDDAPSYSTEFDINRLAIGDIQGDGKNNDLAWIAGDKSIKILNNVDGIGQPYEITISERGYRNVSMSFIDLNGDGKEEHLVLVGYYRVNDGSFVSWGYIKLFQKTGNNKWEEIASFDKKDDGSRFGTLSSVKSFDFDSDGWVDVLALGGEMVLLRNVGGELSKEPVIFSGSGKDLMKVSLGSNNDFVYSSYTGSNLQANVFINKCTLKTKCNVCQLGDKTKGDANCDGKITMVDFEIWRNEYFDIKDTNYDWQSSFSCVDELKRPSMVDFGIWRKSYFGV